jgi:hypothetical protein
VLAIKASIHDSSRSTPEKLAASKSRPQPQWPDQRLRRRDFQPWARSCQSVASFARSRYRLARKMQVAGALYIGLSRQLRC